MGFVRIAATLELPAEWKAKEFTCGEKVICVCNVGGTITAMDNVCLHRGAPLSEGVIEGGKLVCPRHGWIWDPKTGEASHSPTTKLNVYPLKVEGEDVLIDI